VIQDAQCRNQQLYACVVLMLRGAIPVAHWLTSTCWFPS